MKPLPLRDHCITVVLQGDHGADMERILANERAGVKVRYGRTFVYLADPTIARWLEEDDSYTVLSVHRFGAAALTESRRALGVCL